MIIFIVLSDQFLQMGFIPPITIRLPDYYMDIIVSGLSCHADFTASHVYVCVVCVGVMLTILVSQIFMCSLFFFHVGHIPTCHVV